MKAIPVLAAMLLLFTACEFERDALYDAAESAANQQDSLFNLHATSVTYDSITLEWNMVADAVSYTLYRDLSPDFIEPVMFVPAGVVYNDSGLFPGNTYYYKVCAQYSDGGEDCSKVKDIRTTSLPRPANLRVTAVTESSVTLAWDSIAGIGTYVVHRVQDGMSFSTSGAGYADNSVTAGNTYTYYVTCMVSPFGEGPASNQVTATPVAQTPPSIAPSLVVVSTASTAVNLKWAAVAGATTYKLYRDTVVGGGFTNKVYDGPALHYTDRGGVAGDTTYYYKICAVNGVGQGPYSSEVMGLTKVDSFASVSYSLVSVQSYSLTAIIGSDVGNQLTVGRLVYYKTCDGRFGVFELQQFDTTISNDLMLRWKTWDVGGVFYSGGDGLVIQGTFLCDLDTGIETTINPPADFQWLIDSPTTRSIEAYPGAGFVLP